MPTFRDCLNVFQSTDAAHYASSLFNESFNLAFPPPTAFRILDTEIRPEDWHQFIATYRWLDGSEECVGFCNWIKYKDVYLGGGLAVKKNFYRRLSKENFAECSHLGGVAQIVMETAAQQLTDCAAWFAYVGDAKSMRVVARVGYVPTEYPHLLVIWRRALSELEQRRWLEEVHRIGAF
jgi:hypothetical protein